MAYRYIGNKTRLAPRLLRLVAADVAPGGTVADLMCGTASFAATLRAAGYRVIASDLMTYATYHAHVRLKLDRAPRFDRLGLGSYEEALDHLMGLPPQHGLMYREYSPSGAPAAGCAPRQYLSPENAGRLDAWLAQLRRWEDDGVLGADERALLRHDLVLAVNRVANIAGTYGHFWSQWTDAARGDIVLRPSTFEPGRTDHVVTQGRAEDVAGAVSADLCYLDPPYTKRQYAANYHLIETIARGDEPAAVGVSGLRPWRDQYSDFCSKVRVRASFARILETIDCPLFLVSYSEDGLLGRDELGAFLAGYGAVRCHQFSFPRFRSNKSPLARRLTEFVFRLDRTASPGRYEVVEIGSGEAEQQALFP